MMYFQMNGEINAEMEHKLIDFANQVQDQPVIIILNTQGGGYFQAESIANIINGLKDVTIHVQAAYSAGFMILHKTKCKIKLSNTCRGMWHYGTWNVSINDKAKPAYYEDECILDCMPFHAKESRGIAKKHMNEKEFKKFLKDQNIYFTTKRMREIFADRL